jgi:hypothetical protein
MSIFLVVYLIGLGAVLGFGLGLGTLGAMFGINPSDKTVLKFLGFAAAWPIMVPVQMVRGYRY